MACLGPPIPGAPWTLPRLPAPAGAAPPAPPAAVAPAFRPGPPIPGAPWNLRFRRSPPARVPPAGPTPPAPTPAGRLSPVRPFLPRVPDLDGASAVDRLARHTQILSSLVNSLVAQGQIVQTGQASWTLNPAGAGGGTAGAGKTGTYNSGTF